MADFRTAVLALDCAEPTELAQFYAGLLGGRVRPTDDPDRIEVVGQDGSVLAFLRDHGFAPPSWPRPEDSQQAHLLVYVDPGEVDAAEREAVSLGATPVDASNIGGPRESRLLADPAGHSFLLLARKPEPAAEGPFG
ncbi:VOC family protein [Streptomyces sp. NPDC019396]|uniref:VOC family protein n=1 Tax=Streptomyces sp. NPDC019396 TaxID=3154687 RepID=UPI0033E99E4E